MVMVGIMGMMMWGAIIVMEVGVMVMVGVEVEWGWVWLGVGVREEASFVKGAF